MKVPIRPVAVSPDGDVYFDYRKIPSIPRPTILRVNADRVYADGWAIRIDPDDPFVEEFAVKLISRWNDNTEDGRRQLNAFIDAVEREGVRQ